MGKRRVVMGEDLKNFGWAIPRRLGVTEKCVHHSTVPQLRIPIQLPPALAGIVLPAPPQGSPTLGDKDMWMS